METNLQPRVILLYSLPKSVAEPMRLKGVDYNSVVKMIGNYDGVEVYDLNRDFFSMPHRCNILIILGEFLEDKNALLLQDDSILPITDLVYLVSCSFREVNVIDCAWCYSGKGNTHDELKILTNALVNTINGYTAVETRLALYWLLLKENKLLGRDNYKDFYDKKLSDLGAYQDSMNPKQLASLSEGTNLGTMSTSAAPETVYRNSPFPVKVYIHADGDELDIIVEIKQYQQHKRKNLKLNNGDQVKWDISFDTEPMPQYANCLEHIKGERSYSDMWKSDNPEIRYTFKFFVEEAFPLNGFNGVLKTTIGENKPDEWPFTVTVFPYKGDTCIKQEQTTRDTNGKQESVKSFPLDIKVESYEVSKQYGHMTLKELSGHVEGKIRRIDADEIENTKKNTITITGRIKEDYNEIKDGIEKIFEKRKESDTLFNGDHLDKLKERLYILDCRHKMINILFKMSSNLKALKHDEYLDRDIREDMTIEAYKFLEHISDEFYDKFIKRIYTNEKGKPIPFFTFLKDDECELRREYNGFTVMLANMMVNPQNRISLDGLHKFLFYKKAETLTEKKKEIPSAKEICDKNKRDVGIKIVSYIDKIINDNDLKKELDGYLATKEGFSSVIAYYLREICKSKEK